MEQIASLSTGKLKTAKRPAIAVLDANYYWTEQLFSSCQNFADILLLKPVDFRTFYHRYGSYFIDLKPQQIEKQVWQQRICCPPGWLFHYWPLSRQFFTSLIRQFQQGQPLIFVFCYPYYHTLAKALNSKSSLTRSIYYSVDDYRDYWPGRETATSLIEQQAIAQADLTLCVAQHRAKHLQTTCPLQADRIVHIPHGCSTQFMADEVLHQPQPLPQALSTVARPIAGYIGTLGYRFDFNYFAQVVEQLPDVMFVLGGPSPQPQDGSIEWWQGVERVQQCSNIVWLGKIPHDQIGHYMQSFDVLLMCYSDCNFNHNACPTKLWDYMGTSRPIVANGVVPEVNLWSHVIHLAHSPSDFVQKVRLALSTPGWQAAARLHIAKTHTWSHQAQKLHQILQQKAWCHPIL